MRTAPASSKVVRRETRMALEPLGRGPLVTSLHPWDRWRWTYTCAQGSVDRLRYSARNGGKEAIATLHGGSPHFAKRTPMDHLLRPIRVLIDETLRGLLSGSNRIPTTRDNPDIAALPLAADNHLVVSIDAATSPNLISRSGNLAIHSRRRNRPLPQQFATRRRPD
jgi:hypothetical protein